MHVHIHKLPTIVDAHPVSSQLFRFFLHFQRRQAAALIRENQFSPAIWNITIRLVRLIDVLGGVSLLMTWLKQEKKLKEVKAR